MRKELIGDYLKRWQRLRLMDHDSKEWDALADIMDHIWSSLTEDEREEVKWQSRKVDAIIPSDE